MKKILITGKNSYIGTKFGEYINKNFTEKYKIDYIDLKEKNWKLKTFVGYDVIFHVAGIVHIKETKENKELYYEVNRDLTIELAKKAKDEGVKHFIFMSTLSVYGLDSGVIKKETIPMPKTNYGKSKLDAEQKLKEIEDDNFKITIIRAPMVYGKGCKGNYNAIIKIVKMLPFFPKVYNKRSMIYIDNLSKFIKNIIDNELRGVFIPQDKIYVNTTNLAKQIAKELNKKIYASILLGCCVILLMPFSKIIRKAFGSLIYIE